MQKLKPQPNGHMTAQNVYVQRTQKELRNQRGINLGTKKGEIRKTARRAYIKKGRRVSTMFGLGTVIGKGGGSTRHSRWQVQLDKPENWIKGKNPWFFPRDLKVKK